MLVPLLILAASAEPPPRQIGYPIFVRADGDECTYQIQDMIMRKEDQVSDWMRKVMPVWRVDIVFDDKTPSECIAKAKSVVEQAGYLNVVVRRGSEVEYGWQGPPR